MNSSPAEPPEEPRSEPLRATTDLARELDRLDATGAAALRRARVQRAQRSGLRRALPLLFAVPAVVLLVSLLRWSGGHPPGWIPLALAFALAVAAPLVAMVLAGARAGAREVPRQASLGEYDRQLDLEDRLVTADAFRSWDATNPFVAAALDDGARHTAKALGASLAFAEEPWRIGRPAAAWGTLGVAALVLAAWVAGRAPERVGAGPDEDIRAAMAGTPLGTNRSDERPDSERSVAPELEEPTAPVRRADRKSGAQKEAQRTPDLSEEVKESAGKSGAGRSAGAQSTSSASQSRSAPTTQGQASKPADQKSQARPPTAKRPDEPKTEEQPKEQQEEESGATAGRGASKGSNKNPTASDWKSRDQVTNEDDQDIEDDEDTDDEEEEQESRGGVQPHMRDRRPPVSRDLQIGFGNRPNPDANGRGGPSQPKKSRGVASLVLGVPIPDRIKGQPGPGPTKITQERIEPEGEESAPADALERHPRDGPVDQLSAPDLEPWMKGLVRAYFLSLRKTTPGRP